MKLAWTPKSLRSFKRLIRKSPNLRPQIERTLQSLTLDPFAPGLRTHKLKGDLSNVWSCSINYNYRILFEVVTDPASDEESILLINLGSHDEVY